MSLYTSYNDILLYVIITGVYNDIQAVMSLYHRYNDMCIVAFLIYKKRLLVTCSKRLLLTFK